LGFHPATITLVADLVKHLRFGTKVMMRKIEGNFRRIVAQGTDANALAIEGLRLYRMEKKNAQATAMYKRALKLGGPNFSYKGKCHHGLGHIAHSEGRLEEAARHLQEAHRVDPHGVGLLLGDIYTSIDPARAAAVYFQSAIFGEPASFDRLADMELGMSMDATDPSTRSDHHLWALELQRLGNAQRAQLKLLAAAR
jgi:tetratricopeptide (TPR) repeat protein